MEGDWVTFGLTYLKVVEGLRRDVTLIDRNRNLFEDLYQFEKTYPLEVAALKREQIEENFIQESNRPVYFNKLRKFRYITDKKFTSYGLLYKVEDKSNEDAPNELITHINLNPI